tara:strand:+ start:3213 stop:3608 length:396 start_codon:yes stop_codon:yes gene_type:complete
MSYAQDTQAPTPVEEGQTVPFSGVLIPTLQAAEMTARLEQQGNVCQARINSAVDLAVNEVDLRLRNCLSVSTTIDDMYKTQLLSQKEYIDFLEKRAIGPKISQEWVFIIGIVAGVGVTIGAGYAMHQVAQQ